MQKRRLAAIMFTDIVGYTSLMGKDEKKAFDFLRKNRRIHWRLIKKFKGRLLKEMGDGILTSFSSNIDAVMCALSIQTAAKDLEIPLRIGIHLGDVIFENKDVLGDGVNMASRIQGVADTHGIVISETVYKDIKNKEGLQIDALGTRNLKGVDLPVDLFKVSCRDDGILDFSIDTGELIRPLRSGRISLITGILIIALMAYTFYYFFPGLFMTIPESGRSVLVLPFDNYTGSDSLEYFVDGMHNSLIGEIGKISALQVKSKTTANAYRHTGKSLKEIADELHVGTFIEGSVLCLGDSVCLQVKVMSAYPDERQLWVQEYKVEKSEILELYGMVTKGFSAEMNGIMTPEEENRISESRVVDKEAYDLYMKGMVYNDQMSEDALKKAMQYFKLANEKDRTWAAPYRGMASVLERQYQMGFVERSIAVPELSEYIDKALELEPNSSWVYNLKASKAIWSDYDWETGDRDFLKSIQLNPNHAGNHAFYAVFLSFLHRKKEALRHAEIARELDPLNPFILGLCAGVLIDIGHCQEAIHLIEQGISIEPGHFFTYPRLIGASLCIGDYETAFEVMKDINSSRWEKYNLTTHFEKIFREQGWLAFKEELVRIGEEDWEKIGYMDNLAKANLYISINKYDQAMDHLEKAYEMHQPNMPSIARSDVLSKMKDNPRYIALMNKMNLPID
jgi:TolB-like protein